MGFFFCQKAKENLRARKLISFAVFEFTAKFDRVTAKQHGYPLI
jgi:hypothetical protein